MPDGRLKTKCQKSGDGHVDHTLTLVWLLLSALVVAAVRLRCLHRTLRTYITYDMWWLVSSIHDVKLQVRAEQAQG
jgi:hypothetical protein